MDKLKHQIKAWKRAQEKLREAHEAWFEAMEEVLETMGGELPEGDDGAEDPPP